MDSEIGSSDGSPSDSEEYCLAILKDDASSAFSINSHCLVLHNFTTGTAEPCGEEICLHAPKASRPRKLSSIKGHLELDPSSVRSLSQDDLKKVYVCYKHYMLFNNNHVSSLKVEEPAIGIFHTQLLHSMKNMLLALSRSPSFQSAASALL